MGNYFNEFEEYNPKRMAMIKRYNPIKAKRKKEDKFTKMTANLIIFNHNYKISPFKNSQDFEIDQNEFHNHKESDLKTSVAFYSQDSINRPLSFLKMSEEYYRETPKIEETDKEENDSVAETEKK